ncbi:hypothetical protein GCU67_09975 [Modestobacter muralis]|uniref:Glycosyltransferase family 2 protein n=1 Tax=Modestobacter muralis TaxID=1608614 RepID=A0A6P0HBQ0_9ACTN|nr:hypothetical protein [Modestobacter muralis]NEK94496.1 hypothetical protein [Modestobacter muralis]NEN51384.1 hypothetical protein [Modestobacter muralis]
MHVHVLYRTHAGSNSKPRPSWFDRRTAWESLCASLAQVPDVTVTAVVDGSLPPELVAPLRSVEQVTVRGGQASSSFRRALTLAGQLADRAPEDTLFWLAEDDYLYRPEAMSSLLAAAAAVPSADYLTLHTPDDAAWHATHPSQPDPQPPSLAGGPVQAGSATWQRIGKTTSTFGVRAAALREDRWLMDLGSRVGAPFDMATWHALQGWQPFPWAHVLDDVDRTPGLRGSAKVVAKPVMRSVLNVVSRRVARERVLLAPTEDLAVHMELAQVTDDAAWATLARDTATDAGRPAAS